MQTIEILNLTQHESSAEQKQMNVVSLDSKFKMGLKDLLTFDEIPLSAFDVMGRAKILVNQYVIPNFKGKYVMIGGASYLMHFLDIYLSKAGYIPVTAFTKRVSQEENGVKKSVFLHEGFIISPIMEIDEWVFYVKNGIKKSFIISQLPIK